MDRVRKGKVRRREGMICQWIREEGRGKKEEWRGGWKRKRKKRKEMREEKKREGKNRGGMRKSR